ncbi:MerR family transcriptional regulator [Limosilactobacillus sp.]|jgi:DNA-binding transcriptional MerR regulator|uniref:MerR family transcriptional regulator n=1 Tax=Limosilactobacillus sp. TaxID=2773925 RepID=UPI0025C4D43F|nr:MerR family transcriptional regulator [Limosilactobacillus sp.]MCH3921893.1 MerR family transcriptional regulator [Limosilactobacillus sp.]MCH3928664.1 MerR family transcriptional regulator [Limosilactobacillus sp.]
MANNYSIGQVATMLGLTIDTIRYYDKQGLLPFVKKSSSGRRIFTENDVHLMRTIICLKNAGVSVSDIAKFVSMRMVGDSTLEARAQLLADHERELRTQINDLLDTLSYLKFKEWYYQTAVDAGTEKIHLVPGSSEVVPDLAKQYERHLEESGQKEELARFREVKDYRNRQHVN